MSNFFTSVRVDSSQPGKKCFLTMTFYPLLGDKQKLATVTCNIKQLSSLHTHKSFTVCHATKARTGSMARFWLAQIQSKKPYTNVKGLSITTKYIPRAFEENVLKSSMQTF